MGSASSVEGMRSSGYRIFKLSPGGPADSAGMEVFFDFILDIDGTPVPHDQQSFGALIKEKEGTRLTLTVFNTRCNSVRSLHIIPRHWEGAGLLGATVRYDSVENGSMQGLRVLEIAEHSPAHLAGFVPHTDYILGSGDIVFADVDQFIEYVRQRQIEGEVGANRVGLLVYNSDLEQLRSVHIALGKTGTSLGCGIGTGALHRIPQASRCLSGATVPVEVTSRPHTPRANAEEPAQEPMQSAYEARVAATPPPPSPPPTQQNVQDALVSAPPLVTPEAPEPIATSTAPARLVLVPQPDYFATAPPPLGKFVEVSKPH